MTRSFFAGVVLAMVAVAVSHPNPAVAAGSPPDSTKTSVGAPAGAASPMRAAPPDTSKAHHYVIHVDTPSDSALVALLRRGNYVLLVRHASTDWGQRDADVMNFADRNAQRNLSAIGRAQADSIGKAVAALGLKIGKVLASPMYRCRDTAEIAFGHADTTKDLFIKSKASRDARVKWLSTPLTDGALFVLVTHQDPYIPLFRFERDQMKEADALVIQPYGNDQWKIIAQLTPKDWTRLAAHYASTGK